MLGQRVLYLLLILPNAFSICYGGLEMCRRPSFISSFPSNTGISDFGLKPGGDTKSLTEVFVSTFTNAVQASEVLTDVFEISQTTPANFRTFMYDYVKASATKLGMESPEFTANTAAKAIEDNFETLEPPVMIKVFGNTAAKVLQSEGLLNPTNVVSLAAAYADDLKEITFKNALKDNPEWKLKALMDGIEKFFTSVNLLVADNGQKIASTFANEVKLAGVELRKARNFYAVS